MSAEKEREKRKGRERDENKKEVPTRERVRWK